VLENGDVLKCENVTRRGFMAIPYSNLSTTLWRWDVRVHISWYGIRRPRRTMTSKPIT